MQSASSGNIGRNGNSALNINLRLTRLGFNFTAPSGTIRGTNVTGKLEFDWDNGIGLTVEARPGHRLNGFIQHDF